MVFRRISNDIKTRALWLLVNDYTSDEVCNILGVSEYSRRRWFRNQINFGFEVGQLVRSSALSEDCQA